MANGRVWILGSAAGIALVCGLATWAPWKDADEGGEVDIESVSFATPTAAEKFDAKNAYKYLVDLCKLGPRLTASKPMERQQQILETHFRNSGSKSNGNRSPAGSRVGPNRSNASTWSFGIKRNTRSECSSVVTTTRGRWRTVSRRSPIDGVNSSAPTTPPPPSPF